MSDFTTSNSASVTSSASATPLIKQLDSNVDAVRQKDIALRQRKKAQLSASANSSVSHVADMNADRHTLDGVGDDIRQTTKRSSSKAASSMRPATSDEEDDADSTVLGHCVSALPLRPKERPSLKETRPRGTKQSSQRSFTSENTCNCSHGSNSKTNDVLNDNFDADTAHSYSHPGSSGHPGSGHPGSGPRRGSRGSNTSRQRSPSSAGKISGFVATASQPASKPLGPPPSVPLPPRPLTSPHSSSTHSSANGYSYSSRRSSRASAVTAVSSPSSASVRSSWKSSNQSLVSSHLIPTSSEHSDTSDISDEELNGIRDISKHFPSPTAASVAPPTSVLQKLERSGSHTSSSSGSALQSSRTGRRSAPSGSSTHTLLSSVQHGPTDLRVDTLHGRTGPLDSVNGEESSDSALSDVLNLADNHGALMIGMQQTALRSGLGIARVGLGARILSSHASERSLHRAGQGREVQIRITASSRANEGLEATQTTQHAPCSKPAALNRPLQAHHRHTSKSSKTMSELVAALDLEANEWGQRLAQSEGSQPVSGVNDPVQGWKPSLESKMPETQVVSHSTEGYEHHPLPASESLPSLSSSGSQELSFDDSHGLTTAESSLVRSSSAKSTSSPRDSIDTAAEVAGSSEFRSIYDAYRGSTSTMASRFTAPVVRIEDPEGGEVSDPELEDGVSSSDDMPRKRNKPTRKTHLGFEDQRAALRPRPSKLYHAASTPSRPSQTFQSSLLPTQEEETPASPCTPTGSTSEGADPYAFYQFSPSLPPFMPTGLSPLDLTGRGTWSSIVARASDRMRSRQGSVASLTSLASTTTGPVSMRQIRATAQAKQREVDAAHRTREEMSEQVAAMSYRPFAIHDHAASFASHAGMSVDLRSSVSSIFHGGSPSDGTASGRSTAMSSLGYMHSLAPSVGDYGTRWPVGIGADQGVGPDDVASLFTLTGNSLSRRSSASQPQAKAYVEFSMQTSPQASPTHSELSLPNSLNVDDEGVRLDAKVGSRNRPTASAGELSPLGTDAPLRRRRSAASLLSLHNVNPELDRPGLWPSKIRAPRLSSDLRTRSRKESSMRAVAGEEPASDEESDLDVSANLEDLAERSGVLDTARGSKRKLHSAVAEVNAVDAKLNEMHRPIASIPARSLRISATLDRIRAQRISRSAAWNSSDEGNIGGGRGVLNSLRKSAPTSRPCLPGSARAQVANTGILLHRSKSMVSMRTPTHAGLAMSASTSAPRVRSPSPDLSILATQSDEEEVLLTADLRLDPTGLPHTSLLDEEFDLIVGQTITRKSSATVKPSTTFALRGSRVEVPGTNSFPRSQRTNSQHGSGGSGEDNDELGRGGSKDSQQTVQLHTSSRNSSTSSVIEIIQEADELLSSTSHSIGHSSGHDTNISDSGGTSGHDPPKPNQILADIIKRRRSMRLQSLQTPATPSSVRSRQPGALEFKSRCAPDNAALDSVDDDVASPSMQDTPDTMAGSEIWTSFHADRSSTASTATTWSFRSTENQPPRVCSVPTAESDSSKTITSTPACKGSSAAEIDPVNTRLNLESTVSACPSNKADTLGFNPGRSTQILRRQSSGLPVARSAIPKQTRPSPPHPAKSEPLATRQTSLPCKSEAVPARTLAMRRYQSIASFRPRPSDVTKDMSHVVEPTTPSKDEPVGRHARKVLRHSDVQGHRASPPRAVRSVGGGITPSKLPSLRTATSTTSLRGQAFADPSSVASLARKHSSGILGKLPTSEAAERTRLPSPASADVRVSGLPVPVASGSAPGST